MANPQLNYYANPAFCQQSEFYNSLRRCKSPPRVISPPKKTNTLKVEGSVRHPPVGAQSRMRVLDTSVASVHNEPQKSPKYVKDDYEEQEFYEEMVVDDNGLITEKKFVIVSSQQERNGNVQPNYQANGHRYEYIDDNSNRRSHRYEAIPTGTPEKPNHRYEYIPMQTQDDASNNGTHRYEVAPNEEINPNSGRYALVPVEEVANKNRYAVITQNDLNQSNRYEYIDKQEQQTSHQQRPRIQEHRVQEIRRVVSPQPPRRGNPIATQKLHELLATPKKTQKVLSQQRPQRIVSPQSPRKNISTVQQELYLTPNKSPPKIVRQNSKAQQKLNYAIGTRQMYEDKRHTAIVAPICSSPVQSVYSETTYSQKNDSWTTQNNPKPPVQATLASAAFMMILCGGVSSGLCLYMISIMGRLYYLDFGLVAGFTCLLLGMLGFRTRNCYWLPNRNYISGYIVLSVFSLLTCIGLVVLLIMQPKPGTPLADMTSGAVCCISVISLVLASVGVVSSYCCKYPPPDNRVQHCARGFTV